MLVFVDFVHKMLKMLLRKEKYDLKNFSVQKKTRFLPRNKLYVVIAERVVACRRFGFHSFVKAFSNVI